MTLWPYYYELTCCTVPPSWQTASRSYPATLNLYFYWCLCWRVKSKVSAALRKMHPVLTLFLLTRGESVSHFVPDRSWAHLHNVGKQSKKANCDWWVFVRLEVSALASVLGISVYCHKKRANTLLALAYTEMCKWFVVSTFSSKSFLKCNIKQAPTLVFSVKCPLRDLYRCHINKLSRIF